MSKHRNCLYAALFATAAFTSAAAAETVVNVRIDQARMINIAGQAGTVVVGNPNIADVSVRGSQVFLHGKNQGATNVIVLDREGNQLVAMEVNVEPVGGNPVAIFGAGRRYSYNCAPLCEPTLQVGDSYDDYFKWLAQENQNKGSLATGGTGGGGSGSGENK